MSQFNPKPKMTLEQAKEWQALLQQAQQTGLFEYIAALLDHHARNQIGRQPDKKMEALYCDYRAQAAFIESLADPNTSIVTKEIQDAQSV